MKNTIVRIRRMSLMLFTALALCSSSLVAQNYTYEVKNDQVIDATHFRFDIYMKVNSGTVNYRSSQFTLWISQGFVNGSASVAYVSGSSDISAANIFGSPVYTTATAGGIPPGTGSDTSVIKINSTSITCPGFLLGTTAVRWGTFEVTRTSGGSWGCGSNKLGFYTGQTIGNKVTSNIQVWTACPSTGVTLPIANGTYLNNNLNNQTPAIAAQPRDTSVCENAGTATFSVSVTNSNPGSPISYHWKENGSPLNDGGVYGGVLTSSLTITNPSVLLNGKSYTCDVSQCNTVTSSPGILTVNSPDNITLTAAIACDSYNLPWGGSPVTSTGDYTSPTFSNIHGCDSVIHQHVTINHSSHNADTQIACESYTWSAGTGVTYTSSGTYLFNYTNDSNCPSTDTLHLTINHGTHNTDTQIACESYTWSAGTGVTYTSSGTYLFNYTNGSNCPSTDTLHLTINHGAHNADTQIACESYTWSTGTGVTYTSSGTYLFNYTNGSNCPSTDTLHLTINHGTHNADTQIACEFYTWSAGTGVTYTSSGTYLFNYTNGSDCPSTDTLHLTINHGTHNADTQIACESYTWSTGTGVTYTSSGTYLFNYTNDSNCPSTDTLHLTINHGTHNADTQIACESYTWSAGTGVTYTSSGTYLFNYTNDSNCPSTDTLHLTINHGTHNADTQIACESYTWSAGTGVTYTSSGTYLFNYTNDSNCPSTDTLHLTINHGTHNTDTQIACESYTWSAGTGVTYTSSGTYLFNYTNGSNCPSTDTLHLTINHGTHNADTQIACESYTWSTGTGVTYTSSGTYLFNYTNGSNCPSTDTLHLTINHGTHNADTQIACESYTWSAGTGVTYTSSGTYLFNYTNGSDCPSTDTLHLTINHGTHNADTQIACESYTWSAGTGVTYTSSGTYLFNYTNDSNCPSTDTLHLTINHGTHNASTVNRCSSYTWTAGTGTTYTISGTYLYNYNNVDNCPSTDTLHLTISPIVVTATPSAPIQCFGYTTCVDVSASGGSGIFVGGTGHLCGYGADDYTFTVTDDAGCSGTSSNVHLSEPDKIEGGTSTTPDVCSTSNGTASVTPTGGSGTYTHYSWNSSPAQTTQTATGLPAGNYTVTITDNNGCTGTAMATVSSTGTLPAQPSAIVGPAGACKGQNGVVYSVTNIPGLTYNWSLPGGASGSSTSNSITVNFSTGYAGGLICVTATNVCGTSSQSCISVPVITGRPATPATPSGPSINVCGPTTVTYSVPLAVNATSYQWTVTGTGFTLASGQGSTSITVNVAAGFSSGQVRVYTLSCSGVGGETTLNVYGALSGQPQQAIFPFVGVCGGNTYTYSVTPFNGATSIVWTAPAGASITDGVNTGNPLTTAGNVFSVSITFPPAFSSGNVTVHGSNACGDGATRVVAVRSTPQQPAFISGPTSSVCGQSGVGYSTAGSPGATSYTWSAVPSSIHITSISADQLSVTVTFTGAFTGTGNICVTPNDACGAGIQRCLSVTSRPAEPGTITGSTSVCKSALSVPYSVPSVAGVTYTWSITGGAVATGTGASATVNYSTATSNAAVLSVVASNACGNADASRTLNIAVNLGCRAANDAAIASELEAYPNPTHDKLNVSFNSTSDEKYLLTLYDVTGRIMLSEENQARVGKNMHELDLSHFAKGMYMLEISTRDDKQVLRIIVE